MLIKHDYILDTTVGGLDDGCPSRLLRTSNLTIFISFPYYLFIMYISDHFRKLTRTVTIILKDSRLSIRVEESC